MNPINIKTRKTIGQVARTGLTLIEIMIALTMTLIVLFAMMEAFQYASTEIARGRASLEMSNQMRGVIEILRTDLNGVTVDVRPHTESVNPNGYFETIEGPQRDFGLDRVNNAENIGGNNFVGDYDDIIAFTSRNPDRLYRGRYFGGLHQSSLAEIVWWTSHRDLNNDTLVGLDEQVKLYRRVLLIRPDLNSVIPPADLNSEPVVGLFHTTDETVVRDWLTANDVSVRWVDLLPVDAPDGNRDTVVANTLTDLARREFRYCHEFFLAGTPANPGFHNLKRFGVPLSLENTKMDTQDDIMLGDIIAFDVKVYSRNALVDEQANILLEPSDIGYNANSSSLEIIGSFVDLGYDIVNFNDNNTTAGFRFDDEQFQFGPETTADGDELALRYFVNGTDDSNGYDIAYCTWSPHYEADGIDQDDDGDFDEGTNGLDDDGDGSVDNSNEWEALPPYPYPVRGIKVTFRLIEEASRQVRQQSMVHSFVPE